eukprot:01483.XXX_1056_753_1 [CDS] Oithona nana genome sequencing.
MILYLLLYLFPLSDGQLSNEDQCNCQSDNEVEQHWVRPIASDKKLLSIGALMTPWTIITSKTVAEAIQSTNVSVKLLKGQRR